MSSRYCCCCSYERGTLISIKTKSSHNDGKTLLDYFDSVLSSYMKEQAVSDLICIRCSKALQVAYHFINMFVDSERFEKNVHCRTEINIISKSSSFEEMQYESQDEKKPVSCWKNEILQNKLPLEYQTEMQSGTLSKNLVKFPNSFEICIPDTESTKSNKKINLNFKCIICNEFFKDKYSYWGHNRIHKEIVPYKCKLCNFYTCYAESLFKHSEKNHDLNNVDLDLYQTKSEAKSFGRNLEFEVAYLCILCNFQGCSQNKIDEHLLNIHLIDEDNDSFIKTIFKCPSCHNSFKSLKSVRIHYTMYHIRGTRKNNTSSLKNFKCEKCGKIFDLKAGLLLHKRVCERREPVNCNFCSLKFTSVLKYEQHLQEQHDVAIKHECEVCCKTFRCSEYLKVHCKRHTQ